MTNERWKAVLALMLAIPVVNYVAGSLGRSAGERVASNRSSTAGTATSIDQIRIVVSSQSAEGVTQDQLDLNFLSNLEAYTVERVRANAQEYLRSVGQPNATLDISSESTYVESGGMKLAVVRLLTNGGRQVFVAGVVGSELRRVGCIGKPNQNVPITYGPCADRIEEVFGIRIGG